MERSEKAAEAALARILREKTLSPRMSETANIIVMSLMPTKGEVSPEAAVESMTLGNP